MLLQSLLCGGCGAPLDVPGSAGYVTCAYCKTNLVVKRSGSAVYTEVLDRIDVRTERMSDDIAAIRLYQELEWLDREWALKQEALDAWKSGLARSVAAAERQRPGIVAPVLAVGAGIAWLFVEMPIELAPFMPWVPLFVIVLGAVSLLNELVKIRRHDKLVSSYNLAQEDALTAEQEYMDRRRDLTRRIDLLAPNGSSGTGF